MDIAITWNVREARGDWPIVSSDLALDNPLKSAVMVSLFTDRVAPQQPSSDDTAVGIQSPTGPTGAASADRRGWWGDAFADLPIGSRLWQLRRAVKVGTRAIPREIEDICSEALQWLVDDGVATSVDVAAWWNPTVRTMAEFSITITEPGNSTPRVFKFSWAWEGLT
ncbi:phage GP46 family protein [Komagataeibacter europaeus]|uniref:phage GP46 family protein n=1 Tax=Komagataeibacter europaeus TaxID=33995 RepID=UPI0002D26D4F|nr:phage GP46 family protein [Komagataeibacter europaeus]GBQ38913.1 bacteriophage protein [Komagataeibacter europaeus LMG 18890]